MRFNQTTLLNIALIVIFGLALTQAEAYMATIRSTSSN